MLEEKVQFTRLGFTIPGSILPTFTNLDKKINYLKLLFLSKKWDIWCQNRQWLLTLPAHWNHLGNFKSNHQCPRCISRHRLPECRHGYSFVLNAHMIIMCSQGWQPLYLGQPGDKENAHENWKFQSIILGLSVSCQTHTRTPATWWKPTLHGPNRRKYLYIRLIQEERIQSSPGALNAPLSFKYVCNNNLLGEERDSRTLEIR